MQVRWSEDALADFKGIVEHIEIDSFEAAQRVAIQIYQRIASLAEFPRLGRVGSDPGTRELVIVSLPYIVVYQVADEAVELMRIVHGAQRRP